MVLIQTRHCSPLRLGAIKLLVFVFALAWNVAANSDKVLHVRVLDDNNQQDTSISYFRELLIQALEATRSDFGDYQIERVHFAFSQDRSLQLLKSKEYLDVMHSMSNSEREQEFIAVKVPLLKGLMGKRMLFVNRGRLAEFGKITQVSELQSLVGCQGIHWPDSDILEANGFKIARVVVFESMFEMVEKGRCDYFPRGIHEIFPELLRFKEKHPNLAIVPNLIISYPAPVYYFLGQHNQALAQRLEVGLGRLKENGQFDQVVQKSPLTEHVFPLSKWQGVTEFELTNPILPELDPSLSTQDWLQFEQ